MRQLLRALLTVSLLGLSACAAQKLPVATASTYDARPEPKISENEKALLEDLQKAAESAGVKATLKPDAGLTMVARGIANHSIDAALGLESSAAQSVTALGGGGAQGQAAAVGTEKAKARSRKHAYMRENLLEAGVVDGIYQRKEIPKGYNDGPPTSEELADLFEGLKPNDGTLYVGVAQLDDGANSTRHFAFVVSQRYVTFKNLPRRVEPGTAITVSGVVHGKVDQPELWLELPDGNIVARALAPAQDGSFEERFQFPEGKVGQATIEFSDGGIGGGELASGAIGVGTPAENWPPKLDLAPVTNATEVEKAIDQGLTELRGEAYQGDAAVLEAAKACAAALAAGGTCDQKVNQPFSRIIGDELVRIDDVELWVAELTAQPSVVALAKDKHVNLLGIAAQPIKDKKGRYAVAVVFAGSSGPKATRADGKPIAAK